MKIDFSAAILDLDGTPMKNEKGKDLTLADASTTALLALTQASANESGEDKFKAWEIARDIKTAVKDNAGVLELSPENASFIKTKINAIYGAAVVGPAFTLLNG